MNRFARATLVLLAMAAICAVLFICLASAEPAAQDPAPPATYQITGTVHSGKTPLPGVTVTAANTLTGRKFALVTSPAGSFEMAGLPRGRYVVRVEFMGFAPVTQEVVLNPESPVGKIDAELTLASRQQEAPGGNALAFAAAGRGFQNLTLESALAGLASGAAGGAADLSGLPLSGASADVATESVSISGVQGRTQDFGGGNESELEERIQEFRERAQREGGPGGLGGGGAGGGFAGGPISIGRLRNFNVNQPHGLLYLNDANSALDAKSYSLSGLNTPKADYNQTRFGVTLGGPFRIPKILNGDGKTFFFGGWNGSRGSSPYDAFSTVPTAAERAGNFSAATYNNGTPVAIFDPSTGAPIPGNQLDPAQFSPAAVELLPFIPLPNLATPTQNFHFVTSADSSSDAFNFRLIHNFGTAAAPRTGARGGGGGGGGRRRGQSNVNFGINWSRNKTSIVNPFPSLAGVNSSEGLNASAGWVFTRGRITNNLRVNYNHNHVRTTNLFSGVLDVAGQAGITGISDDPFDWGLPGISFTTFGGLNDPMPRRELDQTYTISDSVVWNRGKHNWRFGGDYRRVLQSFRSAKNAEGSFVFTGFATAAHAGVTPVPNTGDDFADFLLGLPQQTSIQSGTNSYDFRANAMDLFVQDDWRLRPTLSFNLGLRYEYNGPYTEAHNQIVNLDIAPGFTAAAPVLPGQAGEFSGAFPASLIAPDRNNFAPRVGIAWKPQQKTVVRAGYGINYNLAQYGSIIQNFAFQPPFATASTNSSSLASPLTLENGFPDVSGTVTNNFAVDRNYRLGYVQLWNLNVQHELRGGIVVTIGYNGAKGTHLDLERAPNRNPDGTLRIPGVQPFLYESSAADSILHAATVSVRKRMAKGLGLGATYVYAKSIDDASSIGGGATVVAQNDQDLAAERGLSSFDQRHKFTGNWAYDLPFGENHRLASKGPLLHVLAGWQWSGSFTLASGLPLTPRVLGGFTDVNSGVNGTLRANYLGGPIALADPTTGEWFNTAVFSDPPAASFGTAGRNIIEGPGQVAVNMSINKTFQIKDSRALELRLTANNVFNTVEYTSINAIVNSLTFGQVVGTGNMRRITLLARFRF